MESNLQMALKRSRTTIRHMRKRRQCTVNTVTSIQDVVDPWKKSSSISLICLPLRTQGPGTR